MAIFDLSIMLFYIVVFLISAFFYDHKDRKYAEGKSLEISATKSFKYVYPYLRFSTCIFGAISLFYDFPLLLEFHNSQLISVVGVLVSILGLTIFVRSKVIIGENYSPCFDSLVPQSITTTGFYRYIRHPIYTGNIILMIGLSLISGSSWVFLNTLVLTFYYWKAALAEENSLCEQISDYNDYMASTGRFIPRINF